MIVSSLSFTTRFTFFQISVPDSQDEEKTKVTPADPQVRTVEDLARKNFNLVQEVHALRERLASSAEASESAAKPKMDLGKSDEELPPSGTGGGAATAGAAAVTPKTAAASVTAGTTTGGSGGLGPGPGAPSVTTTSEASSSSKQRRLIQAGYYPSTNENVAHHKRQNCSPETRRRLDRLNAKTARRREKSSKK